MASIHPENGAVDKPRSALERLAAFRLAFFGEVSVRSVPGKSPFADIMKLGYIHYIPAINVLYDMLFELAPLPEETMRTLSVMSLISALLTSVVAGIMMNGSYNEFAATLDRWDGDTNYGLYAKLVKERDEGYWEYDNVSFGERTYFLYLEISMAGTKILGALLCTVILYISLSNTSFSDPYGNFSYPLLAAWWTYARWVMLINILFIILGVWFFLTAMYLNFKLRRTWPLFEREWDDDYEPPLDTYDGMMDGLGSPTRMRPHNFLAQEGTTSIAIPVLVVFVALLSAGLIMKSRKYVKIRREEIGNIVKINNAVEAAIGPDLAKKFGHFILSSRIAPEDLPELGDPYLLHRFLSVPLGPAIKIAKAFKLSRRSSGSAPTLEASVEKTEVVSALHSGANEPAEVGGV